jgi:hypothetical protein
MFFMQALEIHYFPFSPFPFFLITRTAFVFRCILFSMQVIDDIRSVLIQNFEI